MVSSRWLCVQYHWECGSGIRKEGMAGNIGVRIYTFQGKVKEKDKQRRLKSPMHLSDQTGLSFSSLLLATGLRHVTCLCSSCMLVLPTMTPFVVLSPWELVSLAPSNSSGSLKTSNQVFLFTCMFISEINFTSNHCCLI